MMKGDGEAEMKENALAIVHMHVDQYFLWLCYFYATLISGTICISKWMARERWKYIFQTW